MGVVSVVSLNNWFPLQIVIGTKEKVKQRLLEPSLRTLAQRRYLPNIYLSVIDSLKNISDFTSPCATNGEGGILVDIWWFHHQTRQERMIRLETQPTFLW